MVETWIEDWEEEIPYVFSEVPEEKPVEAQSIRIPLVVEVQEQGEETAVVGAVGVQDPIQMERTEGRRQETETSSSQPVRTPAHQVEGQGGVEASIPVRWIQRETQATDSWDAMQWERNPRPSQFPERTLGRDQEPQAHQTIEASVCMPTAKSVLPPSSPGRKWGTPVFVLGIVILILTIAVLIASRSHSNPVATPSDRPKRPHG